MKPFVNLRLTFEVLLVGTVWVLSVKCWVLRFSVLRLTFSSTTTTQKWLIINKKQKL